jgi:hypothetical protein
MKVQGCMLLSTKEQRKVLNLGGPLVSPGHLAVQGVGNQYCLGVHTCMMMRG